MATLIAEVSAFRDRHPRKLIIIAMTLATLIIALLFNRRMVMGWWYYRSEYSKITEGYDYLAEMCYHTLREPNMWKRVQNNADWYWYQRCRGHRDGLGVVKTEWELPTFLDILASSSTSFHDVLSSVYGVTWTYPIWWVLELIQSSAYKISSWLSPVLGMLFEVAQFIVSWPQALNDRLSSALVSAFTATCEAISEGLFYIAFRERLSNLPFNIGYLWGKLTSYFISDITTAIPAVSEFPGVQATTVIPMPSQILEIPVITFIPAITAIPEAVAHFQDVVEPVVAALGEKAYDAAVTIVTLPAKFSDFLHDLIVWLFEVIVGTISAVIDYILAHLSIPSFTIGEAWFRLPLIPSFELSAFYETLIELREAITLEQIASFIPGLAESHTWAKVVPALEWLTQGIGQLCSYEYSLSAGPWLPATVIRLFEESPAWLQDPIRWFISQWEWLLLPAFDFVGTSRLMFFNIFLVFIVYLIIASRIIDDRFYQGGHAADGVLYKSLPNFLFFGPVPYQSVEWHFVDLMKKLFEETVMRFIYCYVWDAAKSLDDVIATIMDAASYLRRFMTRTYIRISILVVISSASGYLAFKNMHFTLKIVTYFPYVLLFAVVASMLVIDIAFLTTSYVWPFFSQRLVTFVLNTWPNSCIELATENFNVSLADFVFFASRHISGLYIVVFVLQVFANIFTSFSVPISVSLFGYFFYISSRILSSRLTDRAFGEEVRVRMDVPGFHFLPWIASVLLYVVLVIAVRILGASVLKLELPVLNLKNWFFATATVYLITSWIASRLRSLIHRIGTNIVCELYYYTRSSFLAKLIPDDYAQIDQRALRAPSKLGWFIVPFLFWLASLMNIVGWAPGIAISCRVFIIWVAFHTTKIEGADIRPGRLVSLWPSRIVKALSVKGLLSEIIPSPSFFDSLFSETAQWTLPYDNLDKTDHLVILVHALGFLMMFKEEVLGRPWRFAKLIRYYFWFIFIDNPLIRGLLAIFFNVYATLFLTIIWILTAVKKVWQGIRDFVKAITWVYATIAIAFIGPGLAYLGLSISEDHPDISWAILIISTTLMTGGAAILLSKFWSGNVFPEIVSFSFPDVIIPGRIVFANLIATLNPFYLASLFIRLLISTFIFVMRILQIPRAMTFVAEKFHSIRGLRSSPAVAPVDAPDGPPEETPKVMLPGQKEFEDAAVAFRSDMATRDAEEKRITDKLMAESRRVREEGARTPTLSGIEFLLSILPWSITYSLNLPREADAAVQDEVAVPSFSLNIWLFIVSLFLSPFSRFRAAPLSREAAADGAPAQPTPLSAQATNAGPSI
ncbi:hypothetical protein BDZ45DRAFT_809394 [Acephala macrosclerotiorum]|nr:hypothetical protein BDZ45DRAFT_809394 [Acephala macrosclerotiorum]